MTRARTIVALAALTVVGALLAGCGLKGDLDTPGPLWGDRSREVVDRNLPGGGERDTRIVFTRDDVDLFNEEDEEEEDPFADIDAEREDADSETGAEGDE